MASIAEIQRRAREYQDAASNLRALAGLKQSMIKNANASGKHFLAESYGTEYAATVANAERLESEAARLLLGISADRDTQLLNDARRAMRHDAPATTPPPYRRVHATPRMIDRATQILRWISDYEYVLHRTEVLQYVAELRLLETRSRSFQILLDAFLASLPTTYDISPVVDGILRDLGPLSSRFSLPSTVEEVQEAQRGASTSYDLLHGHATVLWSDPGTLTDNLLRTFLDGCALRGLLVLGQNSSSSGETVTVGMEGTGDAYANLRSLAERILRYVTITTSDLQEDPYNDLYSE